MGGHGGVEGHLQPLPLSPHVAPTMVLIAVSDGDRPEVDPTLEPESPSASPASPEALTSHWRWTRPIEAASSASASTAPTSMLLLQGTPAVTVEYYHTDVLGSVRVVTNAQGQVLSRHDFMPFGEEVAPGTPPTQTRRFTAKERDAETGLDYFGARYYRLDLGRFTTVDPVQTWDENLVDPQRWNRYAYVRNNPLRFRDPTGRMLYAGDLTSLEQDTLLLMISDFYGCGSCVTIGGFGYLAIDTKGLSPVILKAAQFLTAAIQSRTWFASVVADNGSSDIAFAKAAFPQSTHVPYQGNQVSAFSITLVFWDRRVVGGAR